MMKTIEEVINDIEICQKHSTCTLCPYCGNNECKSKWGRDALFYLNWLLQKNATGEVRDETKKFERSNNWSENLLESANE